MAISVICACIDFMYDIVLYQVREVNVKVQSLTYFDTLFVCACVYICVSRER